MPFISLAAKSLATKRVRTENKKRAVEYLGKFCAICGLEYHFSSMTFHHCRGGAKLAEVSALLQHRWETIQAELDKCELVCSNCHMSGHWKDRNGDKEEAVRNSLQPKPTNTCARCGAVFLMNRVTRQYCSTRCKKQAKRARDRKIYAAIVDENELKPEDFLEI